LVWQGASQALAAAGPQGAAQLAGAGAGAQPLFAAHFGAQGAAQVAGAAAGAQPLFAAHFGAQVLAGALLQQPIGFAQLLW